MTDRRLRYVWCTYRDWSFAVLEGLLDLSDWRCALIVTTKDCQTNLEAFEKLGIEILRIDPVQDMKPGGKGHAALTKIRPSTVFHYGWSWLVPKEVLEICPNVTLHPGKLPEGRGGSPIQNQIRIGQEWTYANIIELVEGLDEGDIYVREKISLRGNEVDDVWARMISAGIVATRTFLTRLAEGSLKAVPQDTSVAPTIYKRVKPEQAELRPFEQTARQIYDIVRAHNETDPNTYVTKAWMMAGAYKLIVERAELDFPADRTPVPALMPETWPDDPYRVAHQVNEGESVYVVTGCDGRDVFFTRVHLLAAEPLRQTD